MHARQREIKFCCSPDNNPKICWLSPSTIDRMKVGNFDRFEGSGLTGRRCFKIRNFLLVLVVDGRSGAGDGSSVRVSYLHAKM